MNPCRPDRGIAHVPRQHRDSARQLGLDLGELLPVEAPDAFNGVAPAPSEQDLEGVCMGGHDELAAPEAPSERAGPAPPDTRRRRRRLSSALAEHLLDEVRRRRSAVGDPVQSAVRDK